MTHDEYQTMREVRARFGGAERHDCRWVCVECGSEAISCVQPSTDSSERFATAICYSCCRPHPDVEGNPRVARRVGVGPAWLVRKAWGAIWRRRKRRELGELPIPLWP